MSRNGQQGGEHACLLQVPGLERLEGLLTPCKGAPSSPDISGFALGHRNPSRAVETAWGPDLPRLLCGALLSPCRGSGRSGSHWLTVSIGSGLGSD